MAVYGEMRQFELRLAAQVIAAAQIEPWPMLSAPKPLDLPAAASASLAFRGFKNHIYSGCFVCGTARSPGDGMRVFAGASTSGDCVAAPWHAGASWCDPVTHCVRPRFVWALLDCPGYFSVASNDEALLLGEIQLRQFAAVRANKDYVVQGWSIASAGRKRQAGSAVFDASGDLLACAQATWLTPRP